MTSSFLQNLSRAVSHFSMNPVAGNHRQHFFDPTGLHPIPNRIENNVFFDPMYDCNCSVAFSDTALSATAGNLVIRRVAYFISSFQNFARLYFFQVGTIPGEVGCTHYHALPYSYGHRPSHPYSAGTEHAGFSPTMQTSLAPSAKRCEVLGRVACRVSCILLITACEADFLAYR